MAESESGLTKKLNLERERWLNTSERKSLHELCEPFQRSPTHKPGNFAGGQLQSEQVTWAVRGNLHLRWVTCTEAVSIESSLVNLNKVWCETFGKLFQKSSKVFENPHK